MWCISLIMSPTTQLIIACFYVISTFLEIEGKKPFGKWNRPFNAANYTTEDYIQQLIWKASNASVQDGLQIQPTDYKFHINDVLLGVTLEGDVFFENGVLLSKGQLVKGDIALVANRSADLTTASLLFAAGVDKVETSHLLRTDLKENNVQGSVGTTLKNIDFVLELNHTFASGYNKIELKFLAISDEDASYTILPRNTVTYAIEEISKRNNITNVWYEEALVKWNRERLIPLLLQQAQDLPFPISPY